MFQRTVCKRHPKAQLIGNYYECEECLNEHKDMVNKFEYLIRYLENNNIDYNIENKTIIIKS